MSAKDRVTVRTEQADAAIEVPMPPAVLPTTDPAGAVVAAEPVNSDAEPVKAKRGKAWVTYRGGADVVRVGEFALRPGVPVEMPKGDAEGLLTHPFEEFEVSDEAPPPPVVEE